MLRFDDSLIDLAAAYGGSEQKRGVLLNGEPWMLKLSDRLKENQLNSSYSNSTISEYVCCHILIFPDLLNIEELLEVESISKNF